jgi:hypothetical protein
MGLLRGTLLEHFYGKKTTPPLEMVDATGNII